MPFAAKKRRLRAKVVIAEESLSDHESETELEIDGAVQTEFVPAWAAAVAAPETVHRQQEPMHDEQAVEQPQPAKKTKQKKPKVTKEQRAAAGPPAWRQDSATCPSCVIKPVPGKGRGLVCTRPIKAGEVVVGELPAVQW
jgi:hypothetical protein